jgi:hypothetical protein
MGLAKLAPKASEKSTFLGGSKTRVARKHVSRFAEFSRVKALVEIREGDDVAPAGSVGTVVDVIGGGAGFVVEFTSPKHVVVLVQPSEIANA